MTSNASSSREMAKAYSPKEVEARLYAFWEERGWFAPSANNGKEPFCIIMPPPNVTGELHLGHALVATISDALVRWHRMRGEPTLWLPGEDHASIAAQWVMEQELAKQGLTRQELGREGFLERMWEWMDKYRHIITDQHKTLGASCDWSRERFTMDPGPTKAVLTSFVSYYDQGLVYRGNRIINWCPRCGTALSDLEVDHEEDPGALYYVRYPVLPEGERTGPDYVTVATTRPETIPGDVAVAVNPDDPRFKGLIGATVELPLIGRRIPVVADAAVDTAFGTGALKITPGHDPVDFEVGLRHQLPIIVAMDLDAHMNAEAGPYDGLDRGEARQAILRDLEAQGLLDQIDPSYAHAVGHCYRCRTVVEPIVSEQWFLKVQDMAEKATQAVETGDITIVPERFEKVYFQWLENIRDWCISRQLWWGHRIPAWYCTDCDGDAIELRFGDGVQDGQGTSHRKGSYKALAAAGIAPDVLERADSVIVSSTARAIVQVGAPAACPTCGGGNLLQDPDVLDTWFSSGLWPHSTLGWPDEADDYKTFYPTSVMVTGYDILFFWVARMVMMGLQNTDEAPFRTVYLHGLIRDEHGEKMSKSKGNVISPGDTIASYGTDALRFSLATGSTPGNDMKMNPVRLEAARNFANKLWNAARFVISGLPEGVTVDTREALDPDRPTEDRWIVSRYHRVAAQVDDLLVHHQLGEAGRVLHDFLWNEYCDWYIEMAKVRQRENATGPSPTPVLCYVLEGSLRLLHPFMPYVTEEVWQSLKPLLAWPEGAPEALIIAPYPVSDAARLDADAEEEVNVTIEVVRAVRNARAERNVPPSRLIQAQVFGRPEVIAALERQRDHVNTLARLESIACFPDAATRPEQAVSIVLEHCEVYLPLAGLVDPGEELARLQKEQAQEQQELGRVQAKLSNASFVERAPVEVVAKERARMAAVQERLQRLMDRLKELS